MMHHSNLLKLGDSYPLGIFPEDGTSPWAHALGDFSKNARKYENQIIPDSVH